ncbi:MAG TPA: nitroreductase family deazaflavin-dependent oxidoreductase [Acidimicrobiia bacterium]|jgi:deazaflavin-dependent oxidoreductase (nitroreductase family)|nr:nitroreductase family deazaflavin-dependent oxidoreductase [Acidimicrobiia bacterium]
MPDVNDHNRTIIDEFRANGGKLGGNFEGAPMLLLHSTGARSGQPRVNPMMYLQDGDRLVVFASKAGAPTNPDWYHNLVAHPDASVEVGEETVPVHATVLIGAERDRLFAKQAQLYPGFKEYEERTTRVIPVVALTRTS